MEFKSFGKGIFVTVLLFLLGAGVFALFNGQIFTQEDLNSENVDSVNLECSTVIKEVRTSTDSQIFVQVVECFDFEALSDGTYEIFLKKFVYIADIHNEILTCTSENSIDFCKNQINIRFSREHQTNTKGIRDEVRGFQGRTDLGNFDPREWGLNESELN